MHGDTNILLAEYLVSHDVKMAGEAAYKEELGVKFSVNHWIIHAKQ